MGSLGGFCPDAVQVLNFLSQKWELKFNTRASHALSLLRRRFALVLQKCQAAQIIDRGILAEVLAYKARVMGLPRDPLASLHRCVAVCLTLVFCFVVRAKMSLLMSGYRFIYNLICLLFLD